MWVVLEMGYLSLEWTKMSFTFLALLWPTITLLLLTQANFGLLSRMCLSFEMRSFIGGLLGLYGKMQNRGVSFGVPTCLPDVRRSALLSLDNLCIYNGPGSLRHFLQNPHCKDRCFSLILSSCLYVGGGTISSVCRNDYPWV